MVTGPEIELNPSGSISGHLLRRLVRLLAPLLVRLLAVDAVESV